MMRFIVLLLLSCSVQAEPISHFDYADGSGNLYHVSPSLLKYEPVTPNQSSSGIYSGGLPTTKILSPEDYNTLMNRVQAAIRNKAIQINQRLMGSGMIEFYDNNQKTTVLLQQHAKEKQALELFLKTLR